MTTSDPKNWQKPISDVVWQSLIARTESRYNDLSYKDYSDSKGTTQQRERFHKAWTSSVEEMHYRLRSSKTRRLFSGAFTQMICSQSHWALKEHFDVVSAMLLSDEQWQDLRDILMLGLSARSYIKPITEKN